jgi:hypothetical protein
MLAASTTAASGGQDWLSNHSTLVVGVVGIVVSGILGPAVSIGLSRKSARQQFKRDLIVARRDDLGRLLDEAALLLGAGGTNLRLLKEASDRKPAPPDAEEWARSIFPLGQRLRLRLPDEHPVVRAYDDVRQRLTDAQEAISDEASFGDALDRYEQARAAFLDAARVSVQAPVDEDREI